MARKVLPMVDQLPCACPHCGHILTPADLNPGARIGYATCGLDCDGNLIGTEFDPTQVDEDSP